MTIRSPITAIHVITTGWGEIHREHREGTWLPRILWALTSRSWVKIPINCFLLVHNDGPVLFDAGLDPAIATRPDYISSAIIRFLTHRIFRLHINEDDRLDRKLGAAGFDAADIRTIAFSHLHFDHTGGIACVPQAQLIVSKEEWAILSERHPENEWIFREHIELPSAKWQPVAFTPVEDEALAMFGASHDLMGDGSMILLPTPGHTPGSTSMLVRSQELPPILLIGDITFEAEFLMRDQTPGTGDARQLRATYEKVRELKRNMPGLLIVPSHNAAAADALRAACR